MACFAGSQLGLLHARHSLRLLTDLVDEDDALFLALACRPLRDAVFDRFQRLPCGHVHAGKRLQTRHVTLVMSVARLQWARALSGCMECCRSVTCNHGMLRSICIDRRDPRLCHGDVCEHGWERSLSCPVWALSTREHENEDCPGLGWFGVCPRAARAGQLSVLQWAVAHGFDFGASTCSSAARGGHLSVLQWLRQTGCDWDESTCGMAAESGNLALLQWAKANGCDWSNGRGVCYGAANGGHLEVLQWARANGCEWNISTTSAASRGGHLDVLRWAVRNGCEFRSSDCLEQAKRLGSEAMLEFARATPTQGVHWAD